MSLILSGTNGLSDVDGSAATPAIRGTDTNTGIFFPAADTIAFAEGGVEAMRLDSAGNLAVGATSVPNGRVYINSAASASTLAIQSSTTGTYLEFADATTPTWANSPKIGGINNNLIFSTIGSERMRLDASGRLGIGTTSPTYSLEVATGTSGQQSLANFRTADSTAANNAGVQIFATPSATATSRDVSVIWDADGANAGGADYFWIYKKGNSGQVDLIQQSNAAMTFQTNGIERARIDSSGRFAVGTSNITGGGFNPTIAAKSFVDNIGGGIMVEGSGADATLNMGYDGTSMFISSSYRTSSGYKPIAFYTSGTERMRLTTVGDLLINAVSNGFSASLLISANSSTRNAIVLYDTGTTYGNNYYYQWFVNSAGNSAGSISHTAATTIAFLTSSDKRLKHNIVEAPSALQKINDVKVCSFDWIEDGHHVDYGFIAQDLYDVIPEVVGKGDDSETLEDPKGTWQVEYGRLTPILVKAIQELKAEFDAYKLTHP